MRICEGMKNSGFIFILFVLFSSCVVRNSSTKKYAPQQLQTDYDFFKNILEQTHPGLYWYTPKDSMDLFFKRGKAMLQDSLTEPQFRKALSYVISKLGCGHTTVRPSKGFIRSGDTLRNRQFPLFLKIWKDTAFVTFNLARRDSILKRGVVLTAIDGRPMAQIVDSLFQFLSTDGYNNTHKYQTLNNGGTFGALYLNVFGYRSKFEVSFIDSVGKEHTTTAPIYIRDTAGMRNAGTRPQLPKLPRRERKRRELLSARNLYFDTTLNTAFMELNTFQKSGKLRRFFKTSFKSLERRGTKNLVIDLRTNGGGIVTNSNLLTKYIAAQPFKIADSLYTRTKWNKYSKYQQHRFFNWLFAVFMTRKKKDGNYHFGYYERKQFAPKKRHHYNGAVYVLSGGNTFSASTLFIKAVKAQSNVTVVGEETGGGAYGNNAWLIPDVTLPHTKVRFRLPLYRLVIDKGEQKGFGVQPEIYALPTVEAIRRNEDFKMKKVLELIRNEGK